MVQRFALLTAGVSATAISIFLGAIGGFTQVPFVYMLVFWIVSIAVPIAAVIFTSRDAIKSTLHTSVIQPISQPSSKTKQQQQVSQQKLVQKGAEKVAATTPQDNNQQSVPVQAVNPAPPTQTGHVPAAMQIAVQLQDLAIDEGAEDVMIIGELKSLKEQLGRIEKQVGEMSKGFQVIMTKGALEAKSPATEETTSDMPKESKMQVLIQPETTEQNTSVVKQSPIPPKERAQSNKKKIVQQDSDEVKQTEVNEEQSTSKLESNPSKQLQELNQLKQELAKLRTGLFAKLENPSEN